MTNNKVLLFLDVDNSFDSDEFFYVIDYDIKNERVTYIEDGRETLRPLDISEVNEMVMNNEIFYVGEL